MLEQSIGRYQNRAIEAAQIIEELIALAKNLREAGRRGEELGLMEDEIAFYDAFEVRDSAVKVLGDETLRTIALELVRAIRNNLMIDWTWRENVRAQTRVMIKLILRRYGYPPDKKTRATEIVLEQAKRKRYSNSTNSSVPRLACLMMARKVPRSNSLWSGTTTCAKG